MTAVRFRDAVAYGARVYGFLLLVTVVGGAMLALGGALLWTEFQAWAGAGGADTTAAASGGLLALLGTSILVTGYAGVSYKLLADGVAAGRDHTAGDASAGAATQPATVEESGRDTEADARRAPSVDPGEGQATADDATVDQASAGQSAGAGSEPTAADGPDEDREPAGPPEPTPEEIAFGSSGDTGGAPDRGTESETAAGEADETADTTGRSTTPAGRSASSDPLADPMDDE